MPIVETNQQNIGLRMHDAAPGTLEQRAKNIIAQGFSCVHLALGKVLDGSYMNPAAATPGLAHSVKKGLQGLDIAVLGCYLNLTHPDESVYRETVKKYQAHLALANWMQAGVVGTETGNPNKDYAYEPERSHTDEALELFIRRVEPVVKTAEKLGATLAIEPVYTHIVSDGKRARRVLDAIASPNLKIILDPINLLHKDNMHRRDEVIAEAMELLAPEIAIIHIKDYIWDGKSDRPDECAAGLGEMDYSHILNFVKQQKPYIQMTLECTQPENAQAAREHIARQLMAIE